MKTIIDAHLDLAMNLVYLDRDLRLPLDEMNAAESAMSDVPYRGRATLTLPELRRSRVAICMATLIARSGPEHRRPATYRRTDLDFANPEGAQCCAFAQLAYYRILERQGEIRLLHTREDLDEHWREWHDGKTQRLGVILSMESADPILIPEELSIWFAAGLRAIGMTHYGFGRYGGGTRVEGPLTDLGLGLLKEMQTLGVALDVTHLCDESMDQAFANYSGPVWASHHNARSLVPGDRQMTDAQIQTLVSRKAVIGVALDAIMLHPGWVYCQTTPESSGVTLTAVADQIDHINQLAGHHESVGIGTDLDGGFGTEQTPLDLKRYGDLHRVEDLLLRRGYSDHSIDQIFHGNWLRKFREVLPSEAFLRSVTSVTSKMSDVVSTTPAKFVTQTTTAQIAGG